MTEPSIEVVTRAIEAGMQSPCVSPRGAALWGGQDGFRCAAFNDLPPSSAAHAEARCLLFAGSRARGAEMLHVHLEPVLHTRFGNGNGSTPYRVRPSGKPSCLPCATLMDTAKIAGFWLLHVEKIDSDSPDKFYWRRYTMKELHDETIETLRGTFK